MGVAFGYLWSWFLKCSGCWHLLANLVVLPFPFSFITSGADCPMHDMPMTAAKYLLRRDAFLESRNDRKHFKMCILACLNESGELKAEPQTLLRLQVVLCCDVFYYMWVFSCLMASNSPQKLKCVWYSAVLPVPVCTREAVQDWL